MTPTRHFLISGIITLCRALILPWLISQVTINHNFVIRFSFRAMIKIMISSTVQPSSSSAGVCTWRNSSHLHSLYLPLPLRLSASCSNLHPHIVDGFLENFPDQVVSPMAGGLLLGLWIHLWRGVATIYAGDPSSMIHHHHHCHNHRISVDIEVVFASGVLMMMYSNVLGFN